MADRKFFPEHAIIEPADLGHTKVLSNMIPHMDYEEYAPKFEELFKLNRTENGILTAKWHTKEESALWSLKLHRAIWQLCSYVGQDPYNEVLIMGGYGDEYIGPTDPRVHDPAEDDWVTYEHMYQDGCNICEKLINDVQVPTIGVINGKGFHFEMAVFCDITIMAEDAYLTDVHFNAATGMVPGDGIQIALQEAIGTKRANYALLTGQPLDAITCLEYGLVNEIVPADKVYERAMEIAQEIMTVPRKVRRVTVEMLRKPWKERLAKDLREAFGTEMWVTVTEHAEHTPEQIIALHKNSEIKLQKMHKDRAKRTNTLLKEAEKY